MQDPVTFGRGLASSFPAVHDVVANLGPWTHDLEAYMNHPAVAEEIHFSLFGAQQRPALAEHAPARVMLPVWLPVLLSATFSDQVSQTYDNSQWKQKARLDAARLDLATRTMADIRERQGR